MGIFGPKLVFKVQKWYFWTIERNTFGLKCVKPRMSVMALEAFCIELQSAILSLKKLLCNSYKSVSYKSIQSEVLSVCSSGSSEQHLPSSPPPCTLHKLPKCPALLSEICSLSIGFLNTLVSLEPTPVSLSVGMLVILL